MELRLDNKNALVCGSSQGIGKAIALQFAGMGANVILAGRNIELLKNTINELQRNEKQYHYYITADFTEPDSVVSEVENLLRQLGVIHILVNNTGGPAPGELNKADVSDLKSAFSQHVVVSQLLAQLLIPGMKAAKYGRIINVISIGAKQPIKNLGVSNTIRGAMASWGKTLARELGPFGITVNNLLPGHTFTSRLKSLIESRAKENNMTIEEMTASMISEIPVGRLGKPEDLGYAAGFLASEQASFINGINLPVDGGFLQCL